MANPKNFLIPISLNGQEIQNFIVQNLGVDPAALGDGQVYYNTVTNRLRWHDGTAWRELNYINDASTTTTTLWSSTQIQNAIDNAMTAGVEYKGGYNATTNTPDLDTTPSGVGQGNMYTVTAAGLFFTENVSIGDVLIAEIDNPTTLADWTIVERNLNTATETSEGTVELATQAEVDAGTAGALVVTASTLIQFIDNNDITESYTQAGVSIGATPGAQVITHNLGSKACRVAVYDSTTGEEYAVSVTHTSINSITIDANGATKTVDVSIGA